MPIILTKKIITAFLCAALFVPLVAFAVDTDGDGIDDSVDNCTLVSNASQLDADGDGIGNACDPDLNQSGLVTAADVALMREVLGKPATASALAAAADLNGSGTVTAADFATLRGYLGKAPGPAAVIVKVAPRNAGITTSQTQQCTATVKGNMNQAVSWRVDGIPNGNATVGTVSASGLYTPPAAAGAHTVTAVSQADATKSASGNIGVTDLAGVFTFHNDVGRTGQNREEYALKPTSVSGATFGRRFACAVDGQLYASPLYVANLAIAGGNHNVVFVATEHDSVYAFDADAAPCVQYWQKNYLTPGLITPVPAADTGDTSVLVPEIGITSTPVIDPATKTLYVLARTKDTQSGNYFQRLHAMDLATGNEKFGGPVLIQASVPGTGTGSVGSIITFDPLIQHQRSAPLLLNGVVYLAWASHGDRGNYHGWVIGYNATTLAQAGVYNVTPNADEAGIWMSGNGPAADAGGSIYLLTGNGGFDTNGAAPPLVAPNNDLGDSIVRLWTASGLSVADYFTPASQDVLAAQDWDLGSGGAMVLPDGLGPASHPNLLIGGGKEGALYVLDRQNLGRYTGGGPDQVVQTLSLPGGCDSCGVYGSPAIWQTGASTAIMYVGVVDDVLRAFPLSAGQFPATPASVGVDHYAFPGTSPSISSSGTTNGIVWALDTTNNGTDISPPAAPAILRAYDATNLQNRLYSSDVNPGDAAGNAIKFVVPVIANGKVYVAGDGQLTVYGLLP